MARGHFRRPVRFVIVADLRTGSTLLGSTLNRHPGIRCRGEIFHPDDFPDNGVPGADRRRLTAAELLRAALEPESGRHRAIGFRAMIFLPQPPCPRWLDAWARLAELDDLRVIYLRRENRLAQYVSVRVAQRLGIYHPAPGRELPTPERRPTIRVAPRAIGRWVRERERLEALRRRQLAGRRSLEVQYSELVEDWATTIGRVERFLAVEPLPLRPAKQKQETRPLSSVVENYAEAAAAAAAASVAHER